MAIVAMPPREAAPLPEPADPHRDIELAHRLEAHDIEVMPHLSAPIDEGQFFPKPPLRFRDMAWRIIVVAAVAIVLGTFIFARGTLFR
jgi:hypothetical protein